MYFMKERFLEPTNERMEFFNKLILEMEDPHGIRSDTSAGRAVRAMCLSAFLILLLL